MSASAIITVVQRNTLLARAAHAVVHTAAPLSATLLFGGDRWTDADLVAIARISETRDPSAIVGLATLALNAAPEIIGVWVDPTRRRRGVGWALVEALARASAERTGIRPVLTPVSPSGAALAEALVAAGLVALSAAPPRAWLISLP